MDIISETISLVANGMPYDIPNMRKVISDNSEYNELNIKELEPQITLNNTDTEEDRKEIVEKIKKQIPIAIFTDKDLMISINNNENQLNITGTHRTGDDSILCSLFESLLKTNIDNFSQLNTIALTYIRTINAKKEKLKLLNEDVEKFQDWTKNKTFILTIPFEYDDYIVSFKIQKLLPRDKDNPNRSYQFSAIFNFNFTESNTKQEKLKQILQNYTDHVYSKLFKEKYTEFMSLKYDKEQ